MIHRLRACENFLKYKTASISYIKQRNNRTSFLRISEISNRKKLDTKNLNDNWKYWGTTFTNKVRSQALT